MRLSTGGRALFWGLALWGCGGPAYDTAEEVGEQTEPIQLAFMFAGYHNYVTTSSSFLQARSTAAIRGTNADANTSFASCGATFVSPHYAITAAHCVNQYARGATFTVEAFKTVNLDTNYIAFTSSTVTGTWPNWTKGPDLTSTQGWAKTKYSCSVVRRCMSTEGGVEFCPNGVTPDVDIALIHCPGRGATLPFATTNTATDQNRDIEIWWFHEVLNLPTVPSTTNEKWLHYGKKPSPTNRNDNYHYRVRHQLFPLVASSRPDLTRYRTVGGAGTETFTDVPVCHGTSGSGVFRRAQNVLLGPVTRGVFSGAELCERAELTQPGVTISTFIKSMITHTFVINSSEIIADRP